MKKRHRRKRTTEEWRIRWAHLLEKITEGKSLEQVARECDINLTRVYYILRKCEVVRSWAIIEK